MKSHVRQQRINVALIDMYDAIKACPAEDWDEIDRDVLIAISKHPWIREKRPSSVHNRNDQISMGL